jgi:putative FmdB family regulatory protein
MPIFEYSCDDCGSKFEKLLRRAAEANDVRCPACGQEHLTTQHSTFAAHAKGTASRAKQQDCGADMCGSGACQSGMCGMNFN